MNKPLYLPLTRARAWALAAALCAGLPVASAQVNLDAETLQRIQALGEQAGAGLAGNGWRIEIEPGQLDPRLRLAPCERIEPYLPTGARAWGRSRVGLRCVEGPSAWNVTLPVTVKVFAPAWVTTQPLAAGSVLDSSQLQQLEVDWAAAATPPVADLDKLVGRQLSRPLPPGAPVRVADVRQRQWFGAGDTVQVVARGQGFSVSGEGQALGPGIEGQVVRVRTDNGRVLTGQPVGMNRVEVQL
ncbi:MAG: flagellar basal body P-ring formation protein FlgA [Rubrivivax sp.]|nr:flagellar basal body P-ring formation protein FlgA [Rubrivivax sp.]